VSHLVIVAYLARGNQKEAERYAWSHVAVFPNDTRGWLLLGSVIHASKGLGAQIQHRAVERLPKQYPYNIASPSTPSSRGDSRIDSSPSARLDLEHAMAENDTRAIQRAARELRLNMLDLIRQAEGFGALEFAHDEAAIAGSIAPDDVALWQTRLRLADLLRRDDEFDELLHRMPLGAPGTGRLDLQQLLDLVTHRTGVEVSVPQSQSAGHTSGK